MRAAPIALLACVAAVAVIHAVDAAVYNDEPMDVHNANGTSGGPSKMEPALAAFTKKFKSNDYLLHIGRKTVGKLCDKIKKDELAYNYFYLKIHKDEYRMVKPSMVNSACQKGKAKGGMQAIVKLLDSAEHAAVWCPTDAKSPSCEVYVLRDDVPTGYTAETWRNGNGAAGPGRRLNGYEPFPGEHTGDGCFSGVAKVTTDIGTKFMSELKVGDKVLAMRRDGSTFFDDVYMFGHKDNSVGEHEYP